VACAGVGRRRSGVASDEAFRARFEQESSVATQIEHPNVIPVYEVGEDRGVVFIAVRFVTEWTWGSFGASVWDAARMSRARRTLLTGIATAALGVLAATDAAGARRLPTKSEAAKISSALHNSPATSAVGCFHVRGIVISTAGPWARANAIPCDRRRFDTALAVLQRRHGNWQVRDLGTSGVGCTVAPARVRRDLGLFCP
jgi:hypothetical protein